MSKHDARGPIPSRELADRIWVVGGSVGRTIYAVEDRELHDDSRNSERGTLIGMVDSQELAHQMVTDHNTMLAARRGKHGAPENDGTSDA